MNPTVKINKVIIKDFKNIRLLELDVDKLTELYGKNATGKSSVLEAIHFLVKGGKNDVHRIREGADEAKVSVEISEGETDIYAETSIKRDGTITCKGKTNGISTHNPRTLLKRLFTFGSFDPRLILNKDNDRANRLISLFPIYITIDDLKCPDLRVKSLPLSNPGSIDFKKHAFEVLKDVNDDLSRSRLSIGRERDLISKAYTKRKEDLSNSCLLFNKKYNKDPISLDAESLDGSVEKLSLIQGDLVAHRKLHDEGLREFNQINDSRFKENYHIKNCEDTQDSIKKQIDGLNKKLESLKQKEKSHRDKIVILHEREQEVTKKLANYKELIEKNTEKIESTKLNLDNVGQMLLDKYPRKNIVMCLDNDEEKTHETDLISGRLIVICPNEKGDFNDRPEKSKLLLVDSMIKPLTATIKKIEYLDDPYNMLIKGHSTIISGAKTALKSTGLLNYLFKYQLNIGYFSDWEVSERTLMKRAKAVNAQNQIYRINLNNPQAWENIGKIIKAGNLDCIIEDPPAEDDDFKHIQGTRKVLAKREAIAQKYGIAWLIVRNYSKTMDPDALKKVGGFAVWTNMPRSTIIFFPLDEGHPKRPRKTHDEKTNKELKDELKHSPKVSLMQTMVCNEGQLPKHSALLTLKTTKIEEDVNKSMIDVPLCEIEMIKRPDNAEKWVKARTKEENEKFDTNVWKIMCKIYKEKNGIASLKLVEWICDNKDGLGLGRSTAYKILKHLHEINYIYGGRTKDGQVPITITKIGKDYLE